MFVQEYYTGFQKCAIRCGIVEDMEDTIVHFFGGLSHEIQDIVFHIEFYTLKHLFQLAMLAEMSAKEPYQHWRQPQPDFSKGGASICKGRDCDKKASGCFHLHHHHHLPHTLWSLVKL